jgi:RIO kinase 1
MSWKSEFEEFLSGKTEGEVFEKSTISNFLKLMNKREIETLDFPISTGKEGNVFRGERQGDFIAVKVYRINTATFRNIATHLEYDGRLHIKRDRRSIIYAWAQKEYSNLKKLADANVRVPHPLAVEGNIIIMEYIGGKNEAAPLLRRAQLGDPKKVFEKILDNIIHMYHKAQLVHADLSEYNILLWKNEPVIIDVGQTVRRNNPMALSFLERDIDNLARFFKKYFTIESRSLMKKIVEEET